MNKIAIIFPGQGSQANMMGYELYNSNDKYKQTIDKAFEIMPELKSVMYSETDENINQTIYSQLAIFSNQAGLMNLLNSKYQVENEVYAGFSLGEYSALLQAKHFDYETGLNIINSRSKAMDSVKDSGTMMAAIGATIDILKPVLKEINPENNTNIQVANYNLKNQIVLAGLKSDFEKIEETLKENKVKRLIELKVSGAFHTHAYDSAAEKLNSDIKDVSILEPTKVVYSNVSGLKLDEEDLKEYFKKHMVNGVQWYPQVQNMINDGIDTFIEFGSKSVLSAMVKKIDRSVNVIHISSEEDFNKVEDVWKKR